MPLRTPVARLVPTVSDVLQVLAADSGVLASIALVVTPDAAPAVRITAPAADLRRAAATGTVAIRIAARDDLGLRDLRLRFTKVSGSGESFTFEDGEWPVEVRRTSVTEWTGSYALDLARLGLGPGDSVVYHAVAHDARTGPEGAAESERFLIEIARPGAVAAGDFSLPEPEEKFALSQRMVIQLTERLLERRPRISAEQFRDEAQALAIAQRRVRAEFVFMLGGEVEDEFEEAAHSHEVEAGRLDNRGQGDLTDAVRHMSQAETRLTAADVREALPYEYRALSALQAAFGKARYFMRTLPATVQIDPGRRLAGRSGRGVLQPVGRWRPWPEADRAAALDVLGRLEVPGTSVASVLPALVALDRSDAAWVAQVQAAADRRWSRRHHARPARPSAGRAVTAWMPMPLARSAAEAAMADLRRSAETVTALRFALRALGLLAVAAGILDPGCAESRRPRVEVAMVGDLPASVRARTLTQVAEAAPWASVTEASAGETPRVRACAGGRSRGGRGSRAGPAGARGAPCRSRAAGGRPRTDARLARRSRARRRGHARRCRGRHRRRPTGAGHTARRGAGRQFRTGAGAGRCRGSLGHQRARRRPSTVARHARRCGPTSGRVVLRRDAPRPAGAAG